MSWTKFGRLMVGTTLLFAAVVGGLMLPEPAVIAQPAPKGRAAAIAADAARPRGYERAPDHLYNAIHDRAAARHGHRMGRLPKATPATFDCRTAFGNVLPVDDQGQCGDCFGVSAADGCSMALIRAGLLPLDDVKGRLSSQYGLDNSNAFQGGCGGGDEAQVIDFIHQYGFPLTSEYGPYRASPGRLKPLAGMQVLKIGDYGYCTPSQQGGVASTQDMKNAMAQYGPLSVAFDAGGCNGYQWPEVMSGRGNNVDHAVLCIGWDDAKQAFLGMNQWGSWGGPGGTFWIQYGAWSWGSEAIWVTAGALPPPVPPVPPVPPTPPVPPVPPPPPGPGPEPQLLPTQKQLDALYNLLRPLLPPG